MELFGFDLANILYWHWFVLAGIFFVLEVLSMSFFFLWLGASAVMVGIVLLIAPDLGWQAQFIIWAGISVADVLGWRLLKKNKAPLDIESDEPHLNRRGDQYIDRTFTLGEPIVNGFGKVKVDDSIWKVECQGADIEAGTKVKVTAVDGTVLQVEVVA